ncbi:PIN domain-containing protein [Cytophagales bacterium LB-30]|uniref:PIN domain-containing protein n=1 Tax=Shiella aurantiaca TaxID=3058365 RepID=A0ABT8F524_9BACT|nr:PIN domain-containing protein [Shiella aurantiaca]MDN4165326.1 PIN domain-containing protein [Shiella aurantiaca]
MDRVFVDSDIILDLLSARQPHYSPAAELFSLADEGFVKIFVSSLSFSNVNYILSRQYNGDQARKMLLKFKTLVSILPVNDKTIELALSSEFKDFEDAIQYYTAIESKIETLLTRNLKDFRKAEISVLTAEHYLKSLE